MSDTEKPTPDGAGGANREAEADRGGLAGNVISIEQARAELLRKPRSKGTPPRGVVDLSRMRGREVPTPVTMPPGEHAAVIVTDTPAARAHFDKRTVHPGEAPRQVHDKKVRVKTSLDPRRAKTQMSEKRSAGPDSQPTPGPDSQRMPGAVDSEEDVGADSLWDTPSQPPSSARGQGHSRTSLTRPQRIVAAPNRGSPLFLIGVALAAALGAVLVYTLGRHPAEPVGSGAPVATEPLVVPSSLRIGEPPADTASSAPANPSGAAVSPPVTSSASVAPLPSDIPSASQTATSVASSPSVAKTAHTAPSVKPSASATATASAKPTATSILPFGKEEP